MLYDSPNFEVKPMMHFAQNNYTLILTNHKAEDSRSSAIAEKPARRSLSRLSVEMLSYCCTNNANRLRVSLRREHFQQLSRSIPLQTWDPIYKKNLTTNLEKT